MPSSGTTETQWFPKNNFWGISRVRLWINAFALGILLWCIWKLKTSSYLSDSVAAHSLTWMKIWDLPMSRHKGLCATDLLLLHIPAVYNTWSCVWGPVDIISYSSDKLNQGLGGLWHSMIWPYSVVEVTNEPCWVQLLFLLEFKSVCHQDERERDT